MWAVTAAVGGALVSGIFSERASSRAAAASQGQSDAAKLQAQIAAEQWDRYKEMYSPLEEKYVQDAQNYDSPEQYSRAAGEASATVASQFSKARDRLTRTPGLDPSSGAYQSGLLGLELGQAASDATAQNAARQQVRDTAYARQTNALNLGKGLPGTAMNGLSNAANTQGNVAANMYGLANTQANNAGEFVSNMFGAFKNNGWLGGAKTNTVGGYNADAGITNGVDTINNYALA